MLDPNEADFGKTIKFTVIAKKGTSEIIRSDEKSLTLPELMVLKGTLKEKVPSLTWSEEDSATKYMVYRTVTVTEAGSESWESIHEGTELTYDDTTAVAGTSYDYIVEAWNNTVRIVGSNTVTLVVPSD